ATIALEALLGTEQEITYRLSIRLAGLLAADDDERQRIYQTVKKYYDVRSKIVHGAELKEKHLALIRDPGELVHLLRRTLLAFLQISTGPSLFNSRDKLNQSLDILLLHAKERDELRGAMGLREP